MPFKSHLAVLVLMLCWLHLTGRADSHTATTIVQIISKDKAAYTDVKSPTHPTETKKTTPDSQPTNSDKTALTTIKKITHTAKEEKPTPDSQPTSTIHHTSKDKAPTTKEILKTSALKSDTTTQHGGSSATIPSVFTIASLIYVLLL